MYVRGPAIVDEATNHFGVKAAYLPLKQGSKTHYETVSVNDPDLDFRSISARIGYMDFDHPGWMEAVWVSRKAVRKVIQGLSPHNIGIAPLFTSKRHAMPMRMLTFSDIIQQSGFVDMVRNQYHSFDSVKKLLAEKRVISVAVTRNFAINHRDEGIYGIEYKGRQIGTSQDLRAFILLPEYSYFGEIVEHNFLVLAA